jgi:N-formylglutamate amidohydrolase
VLQPYEKELLVSRYREHHQILFNEVNKELEKQGMVVIVDCHSFPSRPLPCDRDQTFPRPQFCIGTDSYHTPTELSRRVVFSLKEMGCDVRINHPYEGTLVPIAYNRKDHRVASIMIEVNRSLYMNEASGMKAIGFDRTKEQLQRILKEIRMFQQFQLQA